MDLAVPRTERHRHRWLLLVGSWALLQAGAPWSGTTATAHAGPSPHPARGLETAAATAIRPLRESGTAGSEKTQIVPLQCRLAAGPWIPCRMEVEEPGSRWRLVMGSERIDFRHDGRGAVTMQRGGSGPWRGVSSRWEAPHQLCWDGVCARGDIPLD